MLVNVFYADTGMVLSVVLLFRFLQKDTFSLMIL